MKMVSLEKAKLETCVDDAQHEQIIITRNDKPVALILGIEGLDEEQLQLGSSDKFWKLITERREQYPMRRDALERHLYYQIRRR